MIKVLHPELGLPLPIAVGFAGQPEERTAQVAHHGSI